MLLLGGRRQSGPEPPEACADGIPRADGGCRGAVTWPHWEP